jgi:peptidoglycan/xylan/chitin deacetylase (PgdA/CDA1 family)
MIGATNAWDADEAQEPLLDVREIRELQSDGIDFQSHTRTHPSLPSLSDTQVLDELKGSKSDLEQMLGKRVDTVAYPWSRHDSRVERLAEEAGYSGGVIVRRRVNFDHTPLYAIRRIGISCTTTRARFVWDLFRLRWRGE